jgi:outer membrane receptor protein involved in Fe transport
MLALTLSPRQAHAAVAGDSLRGAVHDTAGKPLDAATITIEELSRSVTNGADGRFVFPDVAPGRYTLSVRRLGYATTSAITNVPMTAPLVIELHVSALRLAPVTVTAARKPTDPMDSPMPVGDVSADALRRDASVSLAHALDGTVGVRDITTGQQVGTPVIRGLSGPSVLVLDNGLRLEDYSWSTEDGPSVDPRTADNVEVIRGPASLMYGSNALGGVMNVINPPVPNAIGISPFVHAGAEIYGATNNNEYGGILRLEGASGAFGWAATGIGRKAGNFQTPSGNPETPTGDIYDTGYDALNGNIAVGLTGEKSSGTLRFEHYGGNFGLLDGPPVEEDNTSGPLRKLQDNRVQAAGNFIFDQDARIDAKVQWQGHSLIEVVGDSRIGNDQPPIDLYLNTFTGDVALHHQQGPWLTGTLGVSGMYQTNSTAGVDPLVPDATTYDAALFAFENLTKGKWSFLAGIRGDLGQVHADSNEELALGAQSHSQNAVTGDLGAVYRPVPQLAFSVNVGRAYQAPTLLQYFANGPLPAEGQYLIGLPTAVPQVTLDIDAGIRWESPTFKAELSVYRNSVDHYLFVQANGDSVAVPNDEGCCDTLPVYQTMQTSRATLTGLDLSAEWAAMPILTIRGRFDLVNGENDAIHSPLPLMPPQRGDLEVELHTADTRMMYVSFGTHIVAAQTRLAAFDVPEPAYTIFEAGAGISRMLGGRMYSLDIRCTNLTDVTYTDFLSRYKTFAYAPSRNVIFRLSMPIN